MPAIDACRIVSWLVIAIVTRGAICSRWEKASIDVRVPRSRTRNGQASRPHRRGWRSAVGIRPGGAMNTGECAGGAFPRPRDNRDAAKPDRLRRLYEANRIGFIIEQAGRRASTGRRPVLDVAPPPLRQRIGFVFGSRHEVERHHLEPTGLAHENPLSVERSLSRD